MSDAYVYPRRNLGRAEHWGRTAERRLDAASAMLERATQFGDGSERSFSATLEGIARASEGVDALALEIEGVINTMPRYFTHSVRATGFAVSESWTTVASLSIPRPDGSTRADLVAQGLSIITQPIQPGGQLFQWPFSLSTVSDEFGPRPPLPYHRGIDFARAGGTPIPSSNSGTVVLKGYYSDWGNYIRVDCSSLIGIAGSWIGYAHMQSPAPWNVGDHINQGQTIGYVGTTGMSTGNHLHWETAPGGERINPRAFMDTFGGSTPAPLRMTYSRILIASQPSLTFESPTLAATQQSFSILGGSSTGSGNLTVSLQVRSAGGGLAANANNVANLSINGAHIR